MAKRKRKTVQPRRVVQLQRVRAGFDAAATTAENRQHWANADALSASAAASPSVRATLRNRARYEIANNCYARALAQIVVDHTIGTGPRLQMQTGDSSADESIEAEFETWARAVGLVQKLRLMRLSRIQDGESFALLFTNPKNGHPVSLDLEIIEADRVTDPHATFEQSLSDGISFDQWGNPVSYTVLREHPGDSRITRFAADEAETIDAKHIIHYFRVDRPGQVRGIPEITPALPVFAQLRRYTLAVLGAAEIAASLAVIMTTKLPENGSADAVAAAEEMEITRNMAVFAPEGWEPAQLRADQPTSGCAEVKRTMLAEAGASLGVPVHLLAMDSSSHNYASARLDSQTFARHVRAEREEIERTILDRIFAAWFAEAREVYHWPTTERLTHVWYWDSTGEHVDELKSAEAQAVRLASGTTTLAEEYARQGKDWEAALRQRARELKLAEELGIGFAQQLPSKLARTEDAVPE